MIPTYLLLIPAIATMCWALYTKYQQQKTTDLVILSLTVVAVLLNVFLVYEMIVGKQDNTQSLMQMTAAAFIIPLAYTYFARQIGRQTSNATATTLLWGLILLIYVPGIYIYDPTQPLTQLQGVSPFTISTISNGHTTFSLRTGDFVCIMQCVISIIRIIPLVILLRKYSLHLNTKVYSLFACWALIIIFVIMLSSMSREELSSTIGSCFYFGFYSLLLLFSSVLIAKGYDLYPIQTNGNEAVEDLNVYVKQQYSGMSATLRTLMEDQQLYTDPQLTAESVIEQLQTNHTYFSQMMSSEWGMSFSEYLNRLRLAHVESLLHDESLTISAIAAQSGFSDAGYMSRKFKAKNGMTPSEWRKRLS